jgi:hypothetical protein
MPPHQPENRTNAEIRSSCAAPASQISGRSRRFRAAETSPFRWTFGEAFRFHFGRQLRQKYRRNSSENAAAKIPNSKNALLETFTDVPAHLRLLGDDYLAAARHS